MILVIGPSFTLYNDTHEKSQPSSMQQFSIPW